MAVQEVSVAELYEAHINHGRVGGAGGVNPTARI